MERLVFITAGDNSGYGRMFANRGWLQTTNLSEADLIQFTGGSDVSPYLYDEIKHPQTYADADRDRYEQNLYKQAQEMGIPCAGICRGGQFLNVMNGGKMWQDVDNHSNGDHLAYMVGGLVTLMVTSTHHQMMRPTEDAILIMTAGLSKCKERMEGESNFRRITNEPAKVREDVEVVYYPKTNSLCFQPHPEYHTGDCQDVYFKLLEEYCFSSEYDKTHEDIADIMAEDNIIIEEVDK